MSKIIDLMLLIRKYNDYLFYHKDTNSFDRYSVSSIQLQNLDINSKMPIKDLNNFRFLSYDDINHKEIMSFYVKECVEDKEIRKELFYILRRHDYVDAFIEGLHKYDLYGEFEMVCGDIYIDMFHEWANENDLKF